MRKQIVVRRIYEMKYNWKGHKEKKRNKNRIKKSGQARLDYVFDINHNISMWRWAREVIHPLTHLSPRTSFDQCVPQHKFTNSTSFDHTPYPASWQQRWCQQRTCSWHEPHREGTRPGLLWWWPSVPPLSLPLPADTSHGPPVLWCHCQPTLWISEKKQQLVS